MKLKVLVFVSFLFSASLFAQNEVLLDSELMEKVREQVREHGIKMDETHTSLLSNLKEGNLEGALSAMNNYVDLMGLPEFAPVFSDFISSSLVEVNTCSEAFAVMSLVLFEKAPQVIDAKVTIKGIEMTQHNLRSGIIDAVAYNKVNQMKSLCGVVDYEAKLMKLNETRVEYLFGDNTNNVSLIMMDNVFENNNIKRFVEVDGISN